MRHLGRLRFIFASSNYRRYWWAQVGIYLALLASSAGAQQPTEPMGAEDLARAFAHPATSTIAGFASFRWGTPAIMLTKKLGTPRERLPLTVLDAEVLEYTDRLLGHSVEASYWVTAKDGLVRGVYTITLTYGESCEGVFEELRDALISRYPGIRPVEGKQSDLPDADFCTQVALSQAERISRWDDRSNFVELQLPRGDPKIYVRYGTSKGDDLIRRFRMTINNERAKDIKEKL